MDAGRIKSFTPSVGLRADSAAESHPGRQSDARTVAAKVAPILALDALLSSAEADLTTEAPGVPRQPGGVVVSLSLPVVSAEAARHVARALAGATDYSHLDPHRSPVAGGIGFTADPADALKSGAAAATTATVDRAGRDPSAAAAAAPDVRPELHVHVAHLAAPGAARVETLVHREALSAVAQARDTERLAGLALAAERFTGKPAQLGKLIIGAAIVGALVIVLL